MALVYILKTGGPVDYLRAITWRIHAFCLSNNIFLTPPRLIPSRLNPADYPSRHHDVDSVRISRHTFERISLRWGPFWMDLFASSTNAVCPHYFARPPNEGEEPDEGAAALGALQQPWAGLRRCWIFPPADLIPDVLLKLLADKPEGVIILPHRPDSRWWPLYQRLSGTTTPLHRSDFKVDAQHTSSTYLELSERFLAHAIQWQR